MKYDTIHAVLVALDAEIGVAIDTRDDEYLSITMAAHKAASRLRVDGVDTERMHRFNDETGALTWNHRSAAEHPDRCVCQNEVTPHKHYNHAPYNCARCAACKHYQPATDTT